MALGTSLGVEVRSLDKEAMCVVPQLNYKIVKSAIERIAHGKDLDAVCKDGDLAVVNSDSERITESIQPTSSIIRTHKQHLLLMAMTTDKLWATLMHNFVHNR